MRTVRRRRLGVRGPATVLLAATTAFALTACGDSDDTGSGTTPGASSTPSEPSPSETSADEPSETPSETASATPSATPSPSPSESETAAPKPAKVKIKVVGGAVTGAPDRLPVAVGQTVRIMITSDVAEELHVHGIEELLALPAGEKQTLEFVVPAEPGLGLYEVELEGSSLLLFQLEVR